jgi:hypothetical protein
MADTPAPEPRRRGGRPASDGGEMLYRWVLPKRNTAARRGYIAALIGLIPPLGLPFGMAALVLCGIGWVRARHDPERDGLGHSVAGVIIALLELAFTAVGTWFLLRGLEVI